MRWGKKLEKGAHMPAASISNGHTGPLKYASKADIDAYLSIIPPTPHEDSPSQIAARTMGKQLHVVELWMPGQCNLHCKHCYVTGTLARQLLTASEYADLTRRMVHNGLVDVVLPGKEPLLRDEAWEVIKAARASGARSVGMTTNGTLLERCITKMTEHPVDVINISLDGPKAVHDGIRGAGAFDAMLRGARKLRQCAGRIRMISNCTVNAENRSHLADVAKIAVENGFTFASFHPFECASESDNSLHVSAQEAVDSFESLRAAFEAGFCGSIVLEVESSSFDVLLEMSRRGWFSDMELVSDDTGFLFYRLRSGRNILLVNIMGHPHHFIRTLRIADDGGLSSCRAMAQTGWRGIGDVRITPLTALLASKEAHAALEYIWREFVDACARAPLGAFEGFLDGIQRSSIPKGSLCNVSAREKVMSHVA